MALETVTHISDLVVTNPTSTDPKSEGDNHLRNIKIALKTDLPNISGPVTKTHTQLNNALDKTGDTMTGDLAVPSLNSGQLAGLRNTLINGAFGINQAAPSSSTDDTYAHDQWYVLTQAGAIAVSTLSNVEDGLPTMARLTQSQATAQRMGYAQIIEGKDCKHLRGKQVTFRFGRERMSAAGNIRIAVLEWTGTEDAVTSDVVNDWTSTTYTAGNFFIGSGITVSSVVQQTLAANTLTDGTVLTVTLGSSFNNLLVFAWTEGAAAQNVTFDLGRAQLEVGAVATPFEFRPYAVELMLCQRYYYRAFPGATSKYLATGFMFTTTTLATVTPFPVPMRVAPIALETTGITADYAADVGGVGFTFTGAPTLGGSSTQHLGVAGWTLSAASTAGFSGLVRTSASSANGFLAFSARL